MEKDITIELRDKKLIYGTLLSGRSNSDTLVIFVHGFTGHRNEHIFFNGSRFLSEDGVDSFRFDLYGNGMKDSRHFRDVCISQHGKDVTDVVQHFRAMYKKVIVIGHSYGGTSLLFVDEATVDGFVFWDASYITPQDASEDMAYNEHLGAYIYDQGIEHIVGKKFIEELRNFPDCGDLVSSINKPVLFITSTSGGSVSGKKYLSRANEPKKLVHIEATDHCFNTQKGEQRLLAETYAWVKQI